MTDAATFSIDDVTPKSAVRLSRPIVFAGFFIGLCLSFLLLSGDEQGRVNLLYLLFIFLFAPLAGLIISLFSLISGRGINFARLLSETPLLGVTRISVIRKLRQRHLDKHWFFLQSQYAVLAYSLASIITFGVLLLVTDLNFVWRSTLLTAEHLLPALEVIALPWSFWESAQPTLALLQATQDSRLLGQYQAGSNFTLWWPFILATQLIYTLLLRGLLLLLSYFVIKRRIEADLEQQLSEQILRHHRHRPERYQLSDVERQLPADYALTNWAAFENTLLKELPIAVASDTELHAGPLASEHAQQQAENYHGMQLVLVKAWEPPMAELQDYLQHGQGLLYPVNYHNGRLQPIEDKHLEEWRRFTTDLPDWRVFQPDTHEGIA